MEQVRPLTSLSTDELIARIEQYMVVVELRDAEIRELHAANSALLAERDALAAGALKVIEMIRQEAHDRCGDADKAESWSCVRILRAALAQEQGL